MTRIHIKATVIRFCVFSSVLSGLLLSGGEAMAHRASEAGLAVTHAWTRSVPVAGLNGAGYVTISNSSDQSYRLVAVETESAAQTSLHESIMSDEGMMSMTALPEGVLIPAGQTVALAPGGIHIMLMKLVAPTKAGEQLPATFVFEAADAAQPDSIRLESWFVVQAVSGESHAHH